jgi:protein SCO1/2
MDVSPNNAPGRMARTAGTAALRRALILLLAAGPILLLPATAAVQTVADGAEAQAHASHHVVIGANAVKRSIVDYPLPEVQLTRDDEKSLSLAEALDDGHRPVFVDFIYTTCTAICPVTSATFAALQDELGASRDRVNMLSFSIDPEEDTPRRLAEFRKKYGALSQWHHYTGTVEASIAVQKAFKVYNGDKMGHTPVTFFRAAPGRQWVRLDGFATPVELLREYRTTAPGR